MHRPALENRGFSFLRGRLRASFFCVPVETLFPFSFLRGRLRAKEKLMEI